LLRITDEDNNWKNPEEPLLGTRARQGTHHADALDRAYRNTVCHMSPVTAEEHERVRVQQVMRDRFQVIAP
jgi:hypothetical protein